MIKINDDSRIEIWSDYYINNPDKRNEKDNKSTIIQIEYSRCNDYIVEILDKTEKT